MAVKKNGSTVPRNTKLIFCDDRCIPNQLHHLTGHDASKNTLFKFSAVIAFQLFGSQTVLAANQIDCLSDFFLGNFQVLQLSNFVYCCKVPQGGLCCRVGILAQIFYSGIHKAAVHFQGKTLLG